MADFLKLDDVKTDLPLHGMEGLDTNYASRIRTQFLIAQDQTIIKQMQFADAKAAALLTVMGLVAFRGPVPFSSSEGMSAVQPLYFGLMMLSLLFCIISIFPKIPDKSLRDKMCHVDRWSWPALTSKSMTPGDYANYMQTSEISQLVVSLAHGNTNLAKILLRKYQFMRVAFGFAIATVLVLAVIIIGLV